MKLASKLVVAFFCCLPAAFAAENVSLDLGADESALLDIDQLVPAESFFDIDEMNGFLGLNEMALMDNGRRPGDGRPPVRPGPPRRPPYQPTPPRRPPYQPAPPHRPPYRPYPPPYRPVPPPNYYGYSCYAENAYRELFVGHSSVARWAQDEAMDQCQRVSYSCRPLGCDYR